jgi:hypothetical protein
MPLPARGRADADEFHGAHESICYAHLRSAPRRVIINVNINRPFLVAAPLPAAGTSPTDRPETKMKTLRLNVEALEVKTVEMGADSAGKATYTSATCTFQNTCDTNCHWTV